MFTGLAEEREICADIDSKHNSKACTESGYVRVRACACVRVHVCMCACVRVHVYM